MPFARSVAATAAASTDSAKSTVPTTGLRSAGSVTNGAVYAVASAHEYSRAAESAVRPAAQARPPAAISASTCSASSHSDAMAGVL